MPRNNNRRSSFSRPQQQRTHSTSAAAAAPLKPSAQVPHNSATSQPQQQPIHVQVQNGGILSNILQTAAGVAVGHTVGRALTGMFSSSTPVAASEEAFESARNAPSQCAADTKKFLDCMAQNHDDVASCQMYLEMMRQCQQQFA